MLDFKEILKNKELKATQQRLVILNQLDILKHIDIDGLYENIIDKLPTLSKATLYRNINELIEKNIINEIKVNNKKTLYEITKEPHIHLVCKVCGSVMDNMCDISPLEEKISSKSDFKIESSNVIFNGTCHNCLK